MNVELSSNLKYELSLMVHSCKFFHSVGLLIFRLRFLDVSVFISNFVDGIKGGSLIL